MMTIVGYTHTQVSQPFSSPYKPNDNVVVAPLSFFYGGAITEHIGAFAQVTYNNAAFGGSDPNNFTNGFNPNPCGNCEWSWDNIDVRYANTAKLGNMDVIYGITANNNPSVQDPWNTTPAWGFPYSGSTIAPGPAAATLIDGTYAAYVGGVGGYVFINNLVYLELTGYRTLDFKTLPKLGLDPFGASPFQIVSPYWRVAIEPHWGNHWFEFGAFGMSAAGSSIYRRNGREWLSNKSDVPANRSIYRCRLRLTIPISRSQLLDHLAGHLYPREPEARRQFQQLLSSNPTNTLNTLKAYASFAYGNDNRIVLTGQYFNTWGSSDPSLYGALNSCQAPDTTCNPNSNGFIGEIAYIPFSSSSAPVWPWANVRVAFSIPTTTNSTAHVDAHNNNTLFIHAWFAM